MISNTEEQILTELKELFDKVEPQFKAFRDKWEHYSSTSEEFLDKLDDLVEKYPNVSRVIQ